MFRVILAFILAVFGIHPAPAPAQSLASPYSIASFNAQNFTATNTTGTAIPLNGLTGTSTVGSSFASGNITVTGSGLTTATFQVQGSSDLGVTYYPLLITSVSTPGATPATTATVTSNGLYQVSLAGLTHVRFLTTGTFTAASLSLKLSASPNAISRNGNGGGTGTGGCPTTGCTFSGPVYLAGSPSSAMQAATKAYADAIQASAVDPTARAAAAAACQSNGSNCPPVSGTAGGDLAGSYPNPTVRNLNITNPANASGYQVGGSAPNGSVMVGNGANATLQVMKGAGTIASDGTLTVTNATDATARAAAAAACQSNGTNCSTTYNSPAVINSSVGYSVGGTAASNSFMVGDGSKGSFISATLARAALGIPDDLAVVNINDANYTLTAPQANAKTIIITSSSKLSANRTIIAPNTAHTYLVANATGGAPGRAIIFSTGTTGTGVPVSWNSSLMVYNGSGGEYGLTNYGASQFQFSAPYDIDNNGYVRLTYPGSGSTIYNDHNFLISQVASATQGALVDREINGSTGYTNVGMSRYAVYQPSVAGPGAPSTGYVAYTFPSTARLTATYIYATADPVDPLQLATKQYVDNHAGGGCTGTCGTMAAQNANAVAITGGSLTGVSVTLTGDPTAALQAATKQYADAIATTACGSYGCPKLNADGSIPSYVGTSLNTGQLLQTAAGGDAYPSVATGQCFLALKAGYPGCLDGNGNWNSFINSGTYGSLQTYSFDGTALALGGGGNVGGNITFAGSRAAVGFASGMLGGGAAYLQGSGRGVAFSSSTSFGSTNPILGGFLASGPFFVGNLGVTPFDYTTMPFWVNGGIVKSGAENHSSARGYIDATNNTTVSAGDYYVGVNTNTNTIAINVTLESAPTLGHKIIIKHTTTDAHNVQVIPPTGGTIDGAANLLFGSGALSSRELLCTGATAGATTWVVTAGYL